MTYEELSKKLDELAQQTAKYTQHERVASYHTLFNALEDLVSEIRLDTEDMEAELSTRIALNG